MKKKAVSKRAVWPFDKKAQVTVNVVVSGTIVHEGGTSGDVGARLDGISRRLDDIQKGITKMDETVKAAIEGLTAEVNTALDTLRTEVASDVEEIIRRNVTNPAEVTAAVGEAKTAILERIKTVDALPGFPEAPAPSESRRKKK